MMEEDTDDYRDDRKRGADRVEERFEKVRTKQSDLIKRLEGLRGKVSRRGGGELSEKEQIWVGEVDSLGSLILGKEEIVENGNGDADEGSSGGTDEVDEEIEGRREKQKNIRQRYGEVSSICFFVQDNIATLPDRVLSLMVTSI